MKYLVLIVFLTSGKLFAQSDENKILSVFSITANEFFSDKNKGDPDNERKNLNLSSLQVNISLVEDNVYKAIKSGELAKDRKAIIDFTTAEYKKYLPDLPPEFYEKVSSKLK